MGNILKCGSGSYRNGALAIAIIDVILASLILIMFVLGSGVLVVFEFVGKSQNATGVLDVITDDVFGTTPQPFSKYYNAMQPSNVAEDVGVFLIIMFLAIIDFAISCVFLDGVKTRNAVKCQIWVDMRAVIIILYQTVVVINLIYGSSWYRYIPDILYNVYRIFGIFVGYAFLKEIRASSSSDRLCKNCKENAMGGVDHNPNIHSVIDLSHKRKEVEKEVKELPTLTITGPDDVGGGVTSIGSSNSSPSIQHTRKNSPVFVQSEKLLPDLKL